MNLFQILSKCQIFGLCFVSLFLGMSYTISSIFKNVGILCNSIFMLTISFYATDLKRFLSSLDRKFRGLVNISKWFIKVRVQHVSFKCKFSQLVYQAKLSTKTFENILSRKQIYTASIQKRNSIH